MAIWVSSGAFGTADILEICRKGKELNIINIELSSGLFCDLKTQKDLIKKVQQGQNNFLIHNYFPAPKIPFVLNIACLNKDQTVKTINFAKRAIDLSFKFGAPFYSIHAGFAASLTHDVLGNAAKWREILVLPEQIDKSYEVMIETTQELSEYARAKNISLLIENNVLSPLSKKENQSSPILLNHYSELKRFIKDVDRKNVKLLLDFGHAKVSAQAHKIDPNEYVEQLSDYISCFHLSDNNGVIDSNEVIHEDTWFLKHLSAFKEKEMVLEIYNLGTEEIKSQIQLIQSSLG